MVDWFSFTDGEVFIKVPWAPRCWQRSCQWCLPQKPNKAQAPRIRVSAPVEQWHDFEPWEVLANKIEMGRDWNLGHSQTSEVPILLSKKVVMPSVDGPWITFCLPNYKVLQGPFKSDWHPRPQNQIDPKQKPTLNQLLQYIWYTVSCLMQLVSSRIVHVLGNQGEGAHIDPAPQEAHKQRGCQEPPTTEGPPQKAMALRWNGWTSISGMCSGIFFTHEMI